MSELALTASGEGEQPVLFVHGVLDRGRSWARVAEHLADECRMWWYDRRGYGVSVDAEGVPVALDGHVADLVAIIDSLPTERPLVLAAHSFGGISSLYAALARPERVGALALYETGMAWLPGWPNDGIGDLFFAEDAETAAPAAIFGRSLEKLEPEVRARKEVEGRAFVTEQRTVRAPGYEPPDFGRLTIPVVFGRGESDFPWSLVTDYLGARVAGLEVVKVPGAAHNGHRSHPAEVAGLVRRAVARLGELRRVAPGSRHNSPELP